MKNRNTVTTYRSEAGVCSATLVVESGVTSMRPPGLTAAISPSAVTDSFVRRRSDEKRLLIFQRGWLTHIKL